MYPQGLPPGAIGSQQLLRGGPLPGYFQPIEIRAPKGAKISLAEEGRFSDPQAAPLRVGMLVGNVYRFSVVNIPGRVGMELFPTIEVINRLFTPRGQETRFPVVVELTLQDLYLALEGKLVTRVVYLEEPGRALPAKEVGEQGWFDVAPGKDPLATADVLGRPMAIVRIGGRVPEHPEAPDPGFLFGCPPLVRIVPVAIPQPQTGQTGPAQAGPLAARIQDQERRAR